MSKPLFCQFRDCAGNVPVVGDGKICVIFRIKLKDIYKESDRRRREMNKSRTLNSFITPRKGQTIIVWNDRIWLRLKREEDRYVRGSEEKRRVEKVSGSKARRHSEVRRGRKRERRRSCCFEFRDSSLAIKRAHQWLRTGYSYSSSSSWIRLWVAEKKISKKKQAIIKDKLVTWCVACVFKPPKCLTFCVRRLNSHHFQEP